MNYQRPSTKDTITSMTSIRLTPDEFAKAKAHMQNHGISATTFYSKATEYFLEALDEEALAGVRATIDPIASA